MVGMIKVVYTLGYKETYPVGREGVLMKLNQLLTSTGEEREPKGD